MAGSSWEDESATVLNTAKRPQVDVWVILPNLLARGIAEGGCL